MAKITVQTTVLGSLQNIWDFWTNPKHITKWNFASPDWCCPVAQNNVSNGGSFTIRMEAKDGSTGFDFKGVYTTVIEHQLIEYELEDGRTVSITFEEDGNSVRITETFDAEKENSPEMQEQGWQAILDNFKEYAQNN